MADSNANGEFRGATKAQIEMLFEIVREVRDEVRDSRQEMQQHLSEMHRQIDIINSWRMKLVGAAAAIAAVAGAIAAFFMKKLGG